MLTHFLPVIIVVLSNTFYHISSKSTAQDANPFASLFVTYFVAAIITLILLLINTHFKSVLHTFTQLNWASFVLGIAIIGLEFGYIQAYRFGWNISVCSLICSVLLGIILLFIGILVYREQMTKQQFFGIILCLMGIFFINKK